jgi:2-methylisocitrate lyase-like PEP mutase family enzyme
MVAKLRAALDARQDQSFVIVARTDARRASGLAEAIDRAHAYQQVGADVVFVEALASESEMQTVTTSLSVPVMANMVEGGRTPLMSANELANAGYALVIFPNAVTRVAAFAVADALAELRHSGTTASLRNSMLDFDALSELVGLPNDLATEARYADVKPVASPDLTSSADGNGARQIPDLRNGAGVA